MIAPRSLALSELEQRRQHQDCCHPVAGPQCSPRQPPLPYSPTISASLRTVFQLRDVPTPRRLWLVAARSRELGRRAGKDDPDVAADSLHLFILADIRLQRRDGFGGNRLAHHAHGHLIRRGNRFGRKRIAGRKRQPVVRVAHDDVDMPAEGFFERSLQPPFQRGNRCRLASRRPDCRSRPACAGSSARRPSAIALRSAMTTRRPSPRMML